MYPSGGPRWEVLRGGLTAPSQEMLPTPRIRCQGLGRPRGQSQDELQPPPVPFPFCKGLAGGFEHHRHPARKDSTKHRVTLPATGAGIREYNE